MATVSVIIPTFNRRQWLAATVRSVLEQSFQDIEIIVVDDGSTDGAADMLRDEFGDRIRVESLPHNQGRSTARNVGWALATGEFVAFLDSDDLWLPEKLSLQLPHFQRREVAMVHCWVGKTGQTGERLEPESSALEREFEAAGARGYGYGGITQTWCRMYTSAVVLRRDLLRRTGGFDPRLSNFEDWDLLWRVARLGEVATVPETLVLHRTHPGNTAMVWAEDAWQWLAVNHKHLTELKGVALGPEERRARGNLLMNVAIGEYWRRDLAATRRWMWRALLADPGVFVRSAQYVWSAPLLRSMLPRPIADLCLARIPTDLYAGPQEQAA